MQYGHQHFNHFTTKTENVRERYRAGIAFFSQRRIHVPNLNILWFSDALGSVLNVTKIVTYTTIVLHI